MRTASFGLILLLVATPLAAQQGTRGCSSEESAAFDFWVGSWTVSDMAGNAIGSSRIEKASNGCVVLESWTDANGIDGHSINFYDPDSRSWHQVWMGSNGLPLRLEGDSDRPGRMTMTGDRRTAQGVVQNRITWTRLDDGSVEQLWETSSDGGTSWTAGFRGIYRRS
jgi:hypothetical protein